MKQTYEEFISIIRKNGDDYIKKDHEQMIKYNKIRVADGKEPNKIYEHEHYPDEEWKKVYELGDMYATDQLFVKCPPYEVTVIDQDKNRTTRMDDTKSMEMKKLRPTGLYNEILMDRNRSNNYVSPSTVEMYFIGALIVKNVAFGQDGKPIDGGYLRYLKLKK